MKTIYYYFLLLCGAAFVLSSCNNNDELDNIQLQEEIPYIMYTENGVSYVKISPDNGIAGGYYITVKDNGFERITVRFPLIKGGELVFAPGNAEKSIWNISYEEEPWEYSFSKQYLKDADVVVESRYSASLLLKNYDKQYKFVLIAE